MEATESIDKIMVEMKVNLTDVCNSLNIFHHEIIYVIEEYSQWHKGETFLHLKPYTKNNKNYIIHTLPKAGCIVALS